MKKKEILKTIITIIVSVVLSSGISVYATSTYLYDSCDVSYDNTSSGLNASNVQSSLDELYLHATDYSELKNYFQNNPTSYFDGNWLNIKKIDTGARGIKIFDASDVQRSRFYYHPGTDKTYVAAYNSTGTSGQGTLDLLGNPVMINGSEVMTKSVETFNITASRGKIEFAKGYKIGNIIIIRLWMSFTNVDLSNDTIIAYFPSQYYNGSTDIYFPVANAFSTSNNGCFGHIDADGNIKVRNCSNVGNHIMANVVYVLE